MSEEAKITEMNLEGFLFYTSFSFTNQGSIEVVDKSRSEV